jgi:DNA-binding MarR family transcriptional regulator
MFEEILQLNTNFIFLVRKMAKKQGLTLSQSLILLNISITGSTMGYLANLLGLDPSTMTRNIEKLENHNLLYREKSVDDTRVIYVYKSTQGKIVTDKIESDVESLLIGAIGREINIKESIQNINWSLEKNKL